MKKVLVLLAGYFSMVCSLHAMGVDSMPLQPTLMPIPFTKQSQSSRAAFEENELMRISITKVKEAFDNRGVNTIDFRAKLKQIGNTEIAESDQKVDIKDELIRMSGADIYIEVEANPNYSKEGNSVTILLSAYDAFSGESLSNKVSTSPKFYTTSFEKLVEKAVEDKIEDFLNTLQQKFDDIRENGRTIVVSIGIDGAQDFDLDAEVGEEGELLSEAIERYMEEHAYKGKYHMQGMTSNKIIFDLVKVPLMGPDNKPYRITRFFVDFKNFLKEFGYDAQRDIQGQNVFITLFKLS
jgi:hypothetical protein